MPKGSNLKSISDPPKEFIRSTRIKVSYKEYESIKIFMKGLYGKKNGGNDFLEAKSPKFAFS
jgi:hypothetical protein